MSPEAWAAFAAVVSAASAVFVALIGRRNRANSARVTALELDLLDMRRYAFGLRAKLADHGIETPEPPPLRSEATE